MYRYVYTNIFWHPMQFTLDGVSSSFLKALCAHGACQMDALKGIPHKTTPYSTLKHQEVMVKKQLELFFLAFLSYLMHNAAGT